MFMSSVDPCILQSSSTMLGQYRGTSLTGRLVDHFILSSCLGSYMYSQKNVLNFFSVLILDSQVNVQLNIYKNNNNNWKNIYVHCKNKHQQEHPRGSIVEPPGLHQDGINSLKRPQLSLHMCTTISYCKRKERTLKLCVTAICYFEFLPSLLFGLLKTFLSPVQSNILPNYIFSPTLDFFSSKY